MTRQRWLVLGSHIPPDGSLGGMVRYAVELTRALEERGDTEVHVHCTAAAAEIVGRDLAIPVERIHATASGSTVVDSLRERYGLHRLAASIGADAVLGPKQLVPRRGGGATRVLTVHDLLPLDRPGDFGLLKRLLLPSAYLRSIDDAELLACVSEASRDRLLHHRPQVADRAVVVANAMTSRLTVVEPEPLPELAGRPFALLVGDHSPRKNVGFVLGLWAEVVARVPDATLALVGPPGWGRNEHLADLPGLVEAGHVVPLGRVTDGALRWAYEQAKVTLCPSLLEGFGLPVLEALSFGCPTVVSTDPAQVEAAAGAATVVDVADRARWIDAIVAHLTGAIEATSQRPPTARTWADLAVELVGLVGGLRVEAAAGAAQSPAGPVGTDGGRR